MMPYTEKNKYRVDYHFDNVTFFRPSARKIAVDLGLKVAGAAACYGLGLLVGELMNHLPYVKEAIPNAINYVSGIDVAGNLNGFVGLAGGLYGFFKSGAETATDPHYLRSITFGPAKVNLKVPTDDI